MISLDEMKEKVKSFDNRKEKIAYLTGVQDLIDILSQTNPKMFEASEIAVYAKKELKLQKELES